MNVSLLNMPHECRICRKTASYGKNLFEVEQNLLILQIEFLTGEWLSHQQGWPSYICIRCENDLNIASAFRERCIQTQQELRLELVAAESKPDPLDPLNTAKESVGQNDELIIKDEVLDDVDSLLIFKNNNTKPIENVADNRYDNQNDIREMQDISFSQDPLESSEDEMRDMEIEENTNQIEKLEVTVAPKSTVESNPNKNLKKKSSQTIANKLKKKSLKKTTGDFVCAICDEHFKYKHLLRVHLQHHKKDFTCKVCNKTLSSLYSFRNHAKLHMDENFHCEVCNRSYKQQSGFLQHQLTKTHKKKEEIIKAGNLEEYKLEKKKGICYMCGKQCSTKGELKSHLDRHLGIKRFECKTCQKKFCTQSELRDHTPSHSDERNFQCELCDESFKRYTTLQNHYRSKKHKNKMDKINEDVKSDEEFTVIDDALTIEDYILKNHIPDKGSKLVNTPNDTQSTEIVADKKDELKSQEINENQMKEIDSNSYVNQFEKFQFKNKKQKSKNAKYMCDQCGRQVQSRANLLLHLQSHVAVPKYECNICKKRFTFETAVRRHLDSVHKGLKRFSCKYCDMKFTYVRTKTYHERKVHTNERPFKCNHCDKTFRTGNHRNVHESNVHSNVRNFYCKLCDEYFKLKFGLQQHERLNKKHQMRKKEIENKQSSD